MLDVQTTGGPSPRLIYAMRTPSLVVVYCSGRGMVITGESYGIFISGLPACRRSDGEPGKESETVSPRFWSMDSFATPGESTLQRHHDSRAEHHLRRHP